MSNYVNDQVDEVVCNLNMKVNNSIEEFIIAEINQANLDQNIEVNIRKILEAIEKQIPKKPKINHYEEKGENPYTKICCPNGCHIQLFPVTEKQFAHEHVYCPKCGQRIDWSEEGE